jgi:hypothetical protein
MSGLREQIARDAALVAAMSPDTRRAMKAGWQLIQRQLHELNQINANARWSSQ